MFCKKYAKICAYRDIKAEIKKDKKLNYFTKEQSLLVKPGQDEGWNSLILKN